jgi:Secretion system C-terminal sorting domain
MKVNNVFCYGIGLLATLTIQSLDILGQSCPSGPQNGCYSCGGSDKPRDDGDDSPIYTIPVVHAVDPNDIIGPLGHGPARWISSGFTMDYTIRFENDPDFATAPAQVVRINHPLGNNININTLRLSDFGFGDFLFRVPKNSTFYQQTLDVKDSLGVVVNFTAGIDITRREAFWIFESLDPVTGLPPENHLLGFLPVNDTAINRFNDTIPKKGEGFVSFSIQARRDLSKLDSIKADASIIFDINEPIATNVWTNRLDPIPPTSELTIAPSENLVYLIETSADDAEGSGVAGYDLYYTLNEGPLIPLAVNLAEGTPYVFDHGMKDSTYCFVTIARDHAGNTEAFKSIATHCITVSPEVDPPATGVENPLSSVLTLFPNPNRGQFTIHTGASGFPRGTLSIRDIQGKTVKRIDLSSIHSHELTVDISYANSGVYFLYLENDEGRWVQRFVKE